MPHYRLAAPPPPQLLVMSFSAFPLSPQLIPFLPLRNGTSYFAREMKTGQKGRTDEDVMPLPIIVIVVFLDVLPHLFS